MDRTPTSPRLSSPERVRAALASHGLADVPVKEFAESTATAADAAAAGTPNAVFAIAPNDLARITSARVAQVAQTP